MVTKKGGEVESERWYSIHHILSKDEMGWLKKCYVGEVHDLDVVLDLQERFLHASLYSVQVHIWVEIWCYCKPRRMRISGSCRKMRRRCSKNSFAEICQWTPMGVSRHRYVWLWCYGVPLHAWSVAFFEKIASVMGRYAADNVAGDHQ